MVLAALARPFRRLFHQIRQAALATCNGGDNVACNMETREEQWSIQAQLQHTPSVLISVGSVIVERGDGVVERGSERGMDRGTMVAAQVASGQSTCSRTVSIKRKLEELEIGVAESSASSTSQVRPRREAREDLHDVTATQSTARQGDSLNPVEAQALDAESEMREEDGNAASDADAMCENPADWNDSGSGSPETSPHRLVEWGQNGRISHMAGGSHLVPNTTVNVVDRVASEPGDDVIPANAAFGSVSESFTVAEILGSLEVVEGGNLGRSEKGNDAGFTVENALMGEDLENARSVEQEEGLGFGVNDRSSSVKASDDCEQLEGNSRSSTCYPICGTISGALICNGDCVYDESFENASKEAVAVYTASRTQPRLQFFVRTYIDGRTIVLHSNATDTIESVHRQIFFRTGLPISGQRLIYFGRQLQHDQTLAECRVGSDATLHLVARMRSTVFPQSWQLVNELITTIRRVCAMGDQGRHSRLKLMQSQDSIRSGVKEFLKMAAKSVPISEHMQVFRLAGATSALVMLLLSPVETNRECGEEAIKLFLCPHDDHMPPHIHCHCAPVLLDFCKLLVKSAPSHTLYPVCRNALACLLDTIGIIDHGSTYFNEAKSIVHDFAPFVNELSARLFSNLEWTARAYALKETSLNFAAYVKEGQDFTAFVIPLCKAMEVCRGIEASGSLNPSKVEDVSRFSYLQEAAMDGGTSVAAEGTPVKSGFLMLEIGSHWWLCTLFKGLLHEIANCLEAVEQVADGLHEMSDGPHEMSGLMASDDRPFGLAFILIVLKGLHAIAKLYEGAMDEMLTMLNSRRLALNALIRQSRWQDDHFWLLEHKFLLDFESKRRLVTAMLPEPQEDHDERHDITVHRSQLLSESFEKLAYAESDVLQGGISVEFATEEATGPGVLREWFSLICREIFNPQNALFLSCPNDRRRFFPNPASGVNPGHLTYFRFCGRFIALALMHKVQIDVVFALTFYKQLAGFPISWEDTQDADPCLYESCKKILEMNAEFIDSDALGLTFVSEVEELGIYKTIELCPGGKEMSVTSANRLLYVELLVHRCFVTSVAEQVKCFAQGFADLLLNGNHQQFLRALEPEDFDMMLYGKDRNICLEDWKAHTEYHDYIISDQQITWFWQVVENMTMEQRQRLLFFSTSVKHLPAEGFTGLSSKFHIHKAHTDVSWLPTAHTCFYQLVLPPYPSLEIMHARLHAVTEGHIFEGFGFA